MASASCSFTYIGVAVIPPLLQLLNDSYGFRNSLVLFGALSCNLIVVGVCIRQPKQRKADEILSHQNGNDIESGSMKEESSKFGKEQVVTNIVYRIKVYFSIFIQHKNFTILCGVQSLMFYVYLSWALFLVSVGKADGLSSDQSAFLSTAGGLGGLLGTLSAVYLHHENLINPYTSCFIPLLLNGFCLLGSILLREFHYLLIVVCLSGYLLGLNNSAVFGLMPSMVCVHHVPQALAINYFLDGIMMQISGTVSDEVNIHHVYLTNKKRKNFRVQKLQNIKVCVSFQRTYTYSQL